MRLKIDYEEVGKLAPYANNAKEHPGWQVDQIANSIDQFGFNDPIAVWHDAHGVDQIIEGHGRLLAAKKLGLEKVPVIRLDDLTDDMRRAYSLVHNQLTMDTGFDIELLESEMEALEFDFEELGFDFPETGIEEFHEEEESKAGNMERDFGFVPFSVVNAAAGKWQERKKLWIAKGIKSELGRGGGMTYNITPEERRQYRAEQRCR